jgi:SAM-dependent methyltransferase
MSKDAEAWNEMHRAGYFAQHPYYQGHGTRTFPDAERIARHFNLRPEHRIAVIGSGYGRETAKLAPLVEAVYCLDVEAAMPELEGYLEGLRIFNYHPIPYKPGWELRMPAVDFVYSFNVFQHLSRAVSQDYLGTFAWKLKPAGGMLIQFCQVRKGGERDVDPGRIYEPQVNWSLSDIYAAMKPNGLEADVVTEEEVNQDGTPRTAPGLGNFIWYWAFIKRSRA